MRTIWILAASVLLAGALTGCTTTTTGTGGPSPSGAALGGGPSASSSASPTAVPSSTASTTIDPCQLVTQSEASALTGASYGPGKEETDSSASKRCIYGSQTKNVFEVIVVQAASVDEAKAEKDKLRAEAESQIGGQVDMSQLSGIGDDAEWLHAGLGYGIGVAGLYVVKGTVGFGLVDVVVGASPPSQSAMTGQANTVLSRLP
jgi:hypothetical protein